MALKVEGMFYCTFKTEGNIIFRLIWLLRRICKVSVYFVLIYFDDANGSSDFNLQLTEAFLKNNLEHQRALIEHMNDKAWKISQLALCFALGRALCIEGQSERSSHDTFEHLKEQSSS